MIIYMYVMPLPIITLLDLTHHSPFESLSHALSCDTWVLTQNQDQNTRKPHSILADLF